MQYKILVVEDEADINGLLVKILKEANYQTIQAFSGTEAKLLLEKEVPDLILLDLMLPGMSGEELLRDIRENKHYDIPVLILSAKNSLGDKVSLLKNGADDYITKPFEPEEVLARVQASLRRNGKESGSEKILNYKKLKLYPQSRKVMVDEKELVFTAHEYDILFLLMQNPEKVYSRESLYELVWHGGYYGENNTVNVHVSNIRKKLKENDPEEEYIQTVYGIGFKLQ
ncbi:MAG TPA: DNA-binding response regulator [Lachnoclostridium phytofermentans]|uniref:Stage 0 sporulation protein A homolog n=1 Tax=Lachnoclostridium phytofermentans TaxID=66219 RepID=A0A3D2X5V4_9FIRM|nr:response regulator transcription factor [Lachnoclostridium sp.]HCL02097.1 DNA-binding response regulator [Lachnoclostridium phytofermentans]